MKIQKIHNKQGYIKKTESNFYIINKHDIKLHRYRRVWSAGRSAYSGRRTQRSKGRTKLHFLTSTLSSYNQLVSLKTVVGSFSDSFYFKNMILLKGFGGIRHVIPKTTESPAPFTYFGPPTVVSKFNKNFIKNTLKRLPALNSWSWIKELTPGTFVSNIANNLTQQAWLAKSRGTSASFESFYQQTGWVYVLTPSTKRIRLLGSAIALNGANTLNNKYPKTLQKASSGVSYGKRPTVRGVAMNPGDHPHGGKTKSIKLPRTPWGRIAKKSRKAVLCYSIIIIFLVSRRRNYLISINRFGLWL